MIEALGEAGRRMDGVVLLGAEINLAPTRPEIVNASIDWEAVKRQIRHCSVALRVAPFAGPFQANDEPARLIVDVAKQLMSDAHAHNVTIEEFQFDFDCARRNLRGYETWLGVLREAVHPTHLIITTLPAWLDEPDFSGLVRVADGYVLQVHSVPISNANSGTLCETRRARQWIDRASKLHLPFSVALPTYRCSAGYGPDGKLLSVAMDGVQPPWPPGTRVLDFNSSADEIALLIGDLQESRPANLREIIWYRVPIATDARNWRWPTLSAVMEGRAPEHKLNILLEGENPIDLSIFNAGEADEEMKGNVTAVWSEAGLTASDALTGWKIRAESDRAIFSVVAPNGVRLAPGTTRKIGWLRFDRATSLRTQLSN